MDGWQPAVIKKRAEKIREYLAERELNALVLLDPLNNAYVSGVLVYGVAALRPMATVIPLDGEPFTIQDEVYVNAIKFQLEHGRGWIRDVRSYVEHPRLTHRTYTKSEIDLLLSESLVEKGITKGRVGVDTSLATLKGWVKPHLPELECVDASRLLREMRVVKCEEELDLIRKAGEFSDWCMEKYKEAVKVGKSWIGLEAEVAHIMAEEAAERYPEYLMSLMAVHPGIGEDTGLMWYPGGYHGKKIRKGDQLVIMMLVRFNGYGVENERTFFVGEPTDKQRKLMGVVNEAQKRGVEACIAGNKVSDIDSAAQKVIEDAGYGDYIVHRTGHGIGLGVQEYWLNMAFDHRVMKAGMVTSVEPSIAIYGYGGFHHSDTVIIGEEEPEPATKYTKELEDLIIRV